MAAVIVIKDFMVYEKVRPLRESFRSGREVFG
jgi:hypothetical protein